MIFYVNLALAAWIKFNPVTTASVIMTVVFGIAFAYCLYIHARWWGPVVKASSKFYGPNLKVGPISGGGHTAFPWLCESPVHLCALMRPSGKGQLQILSTVLSVIPSHLKC